MSELGVKRGTAHLVPHSDDWRGYFLEEKARLKSLLDNLALDIQHIGSTAVPGLKAKPLIDVAIAVKTYDDIEDISAALSKLGYIARGRLSDQMGYIYQLERGDTVTHLVHVLEQHNPHYHDYVYMRDYLASNKQAREAYQQLKQQLANEHANERRKYTNGKRSFIADLLVQARNTPKD